MHPWPEGVLTGTGQRDSLVRHCASQTVQGNKVVFEGGALVHQVVQGTFYWLRAKILNGGLDSKLLCAMGDVEMRALEDRTERPGSST